MCEHPTSKKKKKKYEPYQFFHDILNDLASLRTTHEHRHPCILDLFRLPRFQSPLGPRIPWFSGNIVSDMRGRKRPTHIGRNMEQVVCDSNFFFFSSSLSHHALHLFVNTTSSRHVVPETETLLIPDPWALPGPVGLGIAPPPRQGPSVGRQIQKNTLVGERGVFMYASGFTPTPDRRSQSIRLVMHPGPPLSPVNLMSAKRSPALVMGTHTRGPARVRAIIKPL